MNTPSASPAETTGAPEREGRILVWDAPVRVFHWLLAFSFAGAYLTAESERWRLVHVSLGYTMAGLVAFRLVWGIMGTRHARFADFVRGPRAVAAYARSLVMGHPRHYVGHNPAGALAIVGLLALTGVVVFFGWLSYNDLAGDWAEEVHEAAANVMLGLVGVHIAGVLVSSVLHRENLVRAMVSGRKLGATSDGIASPRRLLAAILLIVVAGFWWSQWQSRPTAAGADAPASSRSHPAADDD